MTIGLDITTVSDGGELESSGFFEWWLHQARYRTGRPADRSMSAMTTRATSETAMTPPTIPPAIAPPTDSESEELVDEEELLLVPPPESESLTDVDEVWVVVRDGVSDGMADDDGETEGEGITQAP